MVYFFIHTPKTSGTTFMEVLQNDPQNNVGYFYPPKPDMDHFEARIKEGPAINLSKNPDWQKFNFIGGHFTFGIHEVLRCPSFKYLGVVRDPVSHFVSAYRALMRMSPEYQDYLLPAGKNLEDMLSLSFLHNMQTFFLSGWSIEKIALDKQGAYDQVKENYNKHFAGIYPTEKFDEGLIYFKRKGVLRPMPFKMKNVAGTPRGLDLSPSLVARIKEANDVDVKLYDYFSQKFEAELGQMPWSAAEIALFQMRNRLFS